MPEPDLLVSAVLEGALAPDGDAGRIAAAGRVEPGHQAELMQRQGHPCRYGTAHATTLDGEAIRSPSERYPAGCGQCPVGQHRSKSCDFAGIGLL